MTIHRLRLLGDPNLRARCQPFTKPGSTAVRVILDDMRETLRDWQSRFGNGDSNGFGRRPAPHHATVTY
jgi:peptide deformylase